MGMKFGMVIVVVLVVALVVPTLAIAGQSNEEWPTFMEIGPALAT